MSRFSFIALAVILVAGCDQEAQPPAEDPGASQPVTRAVPEATPSVEPTKTEELPQTTATEEANGPKEGDNPNRLYQLRELKTTPITIGKHKLIVWVMNTESKRREGMMFLKENEVKMEQGMLFVFPDSTPRSFWMQNTYLPLDIAYIAPDGKILNVEKLKPLDEKGVPSKGDAQYVLEMRQGAFKKYGIAAGKKIAIPATVKAEE